MEVSKRIELELKVAELECYDDEGKLIEEELTRFAELTRKYHFSGYNVLKYDLKIRELQISYTQSKLHPPR